MDAASVRGVLLAVALLLVASGGASAHTELVASRPLDGQELGSPPARVAVTFSQALGRAGSFDVHGPTGRRTVAATLDPRDARRMSGSLPDGGPGGYRVAWTATAADGHELRGDIAFRVRPPDIGPAVARIGERLARAAAVLRGAVRGAAAGA
jgi:methionine-rich copper-binding protein CopC